MFGLGFVADAHRYLTGILLCGQQSQHDDLFLERLEHRPQRSAEIGGITGQVGGAAHQQSLLGVVDEGLQQNRGGTADGVVECAAAAGSGVEPVGQICHRHRGRRQPFALQRLAEEFAQPRQLMVVDGVTEFDDALIHPAGIGDDHHQQPGRRQRDHLEVAHRRRRQRRVLHYRHLPSQLRQQPDRAA